MAKLHKITHLSHEALNQLARDPNSSVELVKGSYNIALETFNRHPLPAHYEDTKEPIRKVLRKDVGKYFHLHRGILLGFQNPTMLSQYGMVFGKSPTSYHSIQAEFFVFKAVVGKVLEGVVSVNQEDADYIGCLVHRMFNVTIPKPRDKDEEWIGKMLCVGARISFEITEMSFRGRLPYIKGTLREVLSDAAGRFGASNDKTEQHAVDAQKESSKKEQDENDPFPEFQFKVPQIPKAKIIEKKRKPSEH